MKNLFIATLLFVSFIFASVNTSAQGLSTVNDGPSAKHDEASIELLAGNYSADEGRTTLNLGLKIDIIEGWKTYWRTPGDGGVPVSIKFDGSENIGIVKMQWPAPHRFVSYETIENFGYKHQVVLPISIEVPDPAQPVKLIAKVDYAICDEICVFFDDTIKLEVPAGYENADNIAFIDKYKKLVPVKNGENGLEIANWQITKEQGTMGNIVIEAHSDKPFADVGDLDIFIEGNPNFRFPKPRVDYSMVLASNGHMKAIINAPYEIMVSGASLQNQPLTFTLVVGNKAVELEGNAGALHTAQYIPIILLFAFIGGLILNVMPCVLPVLSLKILGALQHGGESSRKVRASFLSSAAGIIFSFLILAGVIVGIQSTGREIGWGFHFQSPTFLISMVLILTLFAGNMWGFFELRIPAFVNQLLPRNEHSIPGHFFLGVLATLLSTPCSAPFLGTAIGFAFSQGPTEIFYTFLFMGIGLSTPYLMVAFWPKLVRVLPKPGHWMITFKNFLGGLLAISALWLVWVVHGSLGLKSALVLLLFALILLSILKLVKKNLLHTKTGGFLILATVALSFYVPVSLKAEVKEPIKHESVWVKFELEKIPNLVAEGKVVFVDITADWCLTCKANKLLVLDKQEILAALSAPDVVAMEGDWTKPDPAITSYLTSFQRHGIPFNAVYGPGAPDGIVLSELLTHDAVMQAIDKARKK